MNLLTELRRRKVYQVAAIYGAAAWGLLQIADIVFPRIGLPDWSVTFLFALEVVGFPLALILSWVFDLTPDGVVRSGKEKHGSGTRKQSRSLAVLPFNNISDDKSLSHLADGLVEDLITSLQGTLSIPVTSRNSTFVYKGAAVDVVSVAAELGAAFIVEGSVRVQGETARVTAQLIDARNDHHLWAEKYDRPSGDIFALQDELVESMATAIEQQIAPAESAESAEQSADVTADRPVNLNKRWIALAFVLVVGLSSVLTWSLEQRSQERWAREVALPEIAGLIESDSLADAFEKMNEISSILPSDPLLLEYREIVSRPAAIQTDPAGVRVYYRPYGRAEIEWQELGVTPLKEVLLPRGHLLLKFEGEAVVTTERLVWNPSPVLKNFKFLSGVGRLEASQSIIRLAAATEVREGMVYVAPWTGPVPLPNSDLPGNLPIPGFYIDRFEVTNAEFQEFVDAGGYSESQYWEDLDFGEPDWSEAVKTFLDETGESAPAGWEFGRFRHGSENLPVTGVSWFEASAYARFRGKELPTVHHWYRATLDFMEVIAPLGPAIIKQSNFAGKGLAPVGQYKGMGSFGSYDMGGNAREWLVNAVGDLRWIVGGGWNQMPYQLSQEDFASPFDRSPINGFRCVVSADGKPVSEALRLATIESSRINLMPGEPVSDEVYAIFREQFGYLRQELNPQLSSSLDRSSFREEKIHINSPYSEAGMDLLLLLPKGNRLPLQAMVFMTGSDAFFAGATMEGYNWMNYEPSVSVVLQSGRAVVLPVWEGAFGRGRRWSSIEDDSQEKWLEYTRSRVLRWRQDLGTTLDYLETRNDIDSDKLGYLGLSYGASQPLAMLAVEPRLKTAILVAGGLAMLDAHVLVQPNNHAPRLTMPVLMINGRYDHVFPLRSRQEVLFELLGSPADRKKHVIYDAGHVGFPINQQRREIVAWLDTYLGKVH